MADPFLSEIRTFSFNYAPNGWAQCNGQFLPINQNQALFSLLGTTYGGNGQTTFALPDLRGKVGIHFGNGHVLGEVAGQSAHTLTQAEMPLHTHAALGSTNAAAGTTNDPVSDILGIGGNAYGPATQLTTLNPSSVSNIGGSQPHNNMMPYTVLNTCIALQGIFPSQN